MAEEPATPMIIALVGTVEGGPLTDASGRLRLDWVRRHVAARLHRAPMLRRLLLPTRLGQGPQAASPLAFRWLDRRRTLPVASPPVAATSPPGR